MSDLVRGDDIVNEFKKGNEKSLTSIFKLYHSSLRYFAERLILNKEEAEDIVAGSFVTLWHKRPEVSSLQSIQSYLYTVTKNACFNYLKRSERLSRQHEELVYLLEKNDDHALAAITRAEVLRQVFDAVESLPPQCRKILRMGFLEGKKNQEIADELRLSVQTVKNQKLRAISLLKIKLVNGNILALLWLYANLSNRN